MSELRRRAMALTAAAVGTAALLGGSLGMAFAGSRSGLSTGVNYIGGPRVNMSPAQFVSCLPPASWSAIYAWDGATQTWQHYYNTTKGIPAYVNRPEVGGIETLRGARAVAIIMDQAVASPYFIDNTGESCPN